MSVNKETMFVHEADPNDLEDRAVSVAGVDRGLIGHRIRRLRHRLSMTQQAFAKSYGIPLANIRQYEIGRTMPPPAVRAYLKVIEGEPEAAARAVGMVA